MMAADAQEGIDAFIQNGNRSGKVSSCLFYASFEGRMLASVTLA